MINLQQGNCLELMKALPDHSVDLIFTDPPYALGSEIIIRADGKPDYKKAKDFMNKWEMPDAKFWEEWFFEAKRVLKYGGHCAIFGIDRQTFLFQYYAVLNGFLPKQSLYWYFISNFPKASDLSKNIDKRFGAEREIIGTEDTRSKFDGANRVKIERELSDLSKIAGTERGVHTITAPSTPLAQKYKDLKYSVAPLKQTCEEIMVFQKPYKNKSCLNDILAYENGDESITIGALDIENNRVGVSDEDYQKQIQKQASFVKSSQKKHNASGFDIQYETNPEERVNIAGRYPAQTFIDSGTAERLDLQSGVQKGNNAQGGGIGGIWTKGNTKQVSQGFADSGGCSRILHKCDYEETDFDLFVYNPKVAKSERNEGLDGFEKKEAPESARSKPAEGRKHALGELRENNHPTVKPTKLLTHILKLFKTPNEQTILDPFMGSGSMGISAVNCGYNYIGYELDQEYFKIAEARINYSIGQVKIEELF